MPANAPASGYANPADYGYGINSKLGCPWGNSCCGYGCRSGAHTSLSSIVRPADIVYVGDSSSAVACPHGPLAFPNTCQSCNQQYQVDGYTRHNGGSNISFVDGHVKWYSAKVLIQQSSDFPTHYDWGQDHICNSFK